MFDRSQHKGQISSIYPPLLSNNSLWAIVLAGGEGTRLRPLIQQWLGESRPKQYCTFTGNRSMLKHTVDRASALVPDSNILTVIGKDHRRYLDNIDNKIPGQIIEETHNCGTAPGLMLAASYIYENDPSATLLVFPSDHFIYPEDRFIYQMIQAARFAQTYENLLFLLGAQPTRPETDFGWIVPEHKENPWITKENDNRTKAFRVEQFVEKPYLHDAKDLFHKNCFWNTMIMACKAKFLWALGRAYLPDMMKRFENYVEVLRGIKEHRFKQEDETLAQVHLHQDLSTLDFSKNILQSASHCCAVLPMNDISWSDWGRPERVKDTLCQIGKPPRFPVHEGDNIAKTAITQKSEYIETVSNWYK